MNQYLFLVLLASPWAAFLLLLIFGPCTFNFLVKFISSAKLLQSCPTLCNPIDSSPAGSTIPGILQARTMEWVAISFSNVWNWKVKVKSLGRFQLLATPWTAAYGSSAHGIFQARVLEWVAISFFKESSIVEKNKGSGFLYIFFKHEGVLKI